MEDHRRIARVYESGLFHPFACVHIRRGDKVSCRKKECDSIPGRLYVEALGDIADCSSVYVATDDARAVAEVQAEKLGIPVISTCTRDGYTQQAFDKLSLSDKRREIMNFLADLTIMSKAHRFACSHTTNVGRFVALLRSNHRTFSVDSSWSPG